MTEAMQPPRAVDLQQRLQERLQTTVLEVLDESAQHHGHSGANGLGYGTHFRVRIASPHFTGKSRVAQHRLVYDALQDFMALGLHALAIEVVA
ncbi:BolA family transcriptional regulator [Curvibacter sp. CHRR-16]|uniref:BolA family protein n=1 Tax=Curvibacter sp. CHRR-16 TaxID=2835872 RepID=UPI001BD9A148|nr:BolA family protein [Curvibacter sp. CHRR-16]MBT0571544.1 BolA family transcriptional regulator [Curvibacter sp. CHRR-16]